MKSYEAQVIDFGGTFGVTEDLPDGVVIVQDRKPLTDAMVVKKSFFVASHSDWAAIAAAEWETVMVAKVAAALSKLRTIDQNVVLGNRVISQV